MSSLASLYRENMSELGNVSWNENLENYFKSLSERTKCLSWCHKRGEEIYSHRKTFIDLPVIVISSLTGFLSASSTNIFEGQEKMSSILLGTASLLCSVLQTINVYYSWGKRCENHRNSAIQYARLARFLEIELGLPANERMSAQDLLRFCKESYDRLQEVSALIPPEVIVEFKKKFGSQKDISKPEELNGIEPTKIFHDTFIINNPLRVDNSQVSLEIKTPVN